MTDYYTLCLDIEHTVEVVYMSGRVTYEDFSVTFV